MAIQGRASGVNITQLLQKVERDLAGVQKEFLTNLIGDIVKESPVWSGQYVNGHNIEVGVGSARGQFTGNLVNNPKTTNPQAEKQKALSKLNGQIEALPDMAKKVSINNRVPHASLVEYKGWSTKGPAMVYEGAFNRAGIHLEKAVQTIKARQ